MSDLPTFKSTGFQHLDAKIERSLEQAYKLGFDDGIKHQKAAAPPPKARELAKQLEAVTAERDAHWALVERLLAALVNAEEKHINCECPTCDGDTGSGCTCSAPTQWRTVIAEARALRDKRLETPPLVVARGAAVSARDLRSGTVSLSAPCQLERELAELEATDPTVAAAKAKLDQVAAELVSPPLTLRSGNPIHILSDAKRAAIKADWPLKKWVEVSTSFRSCFSPDAVAGEAEKALEVLGSHFTVTLAPGFRFDPAEWSHDQQSGP